MKDLQLVGGDLFAYGRGFATVTGADYVRQRVAMALAEPYGADVYHPDWGSTLENYLGAPIESGTEALIEAEAGRTLDQLVAAQRLIILSDSMQGTTSRFNTDDVISSVNSIKAQPGFQAGTVQLAISLTTQGGSVLQVNRTAVSLG